MVSDVTSETLTVKKSELQLWIREAVREAVREELQLWQDIAHREPQNADLEERIHPSHALGEILDTEFFGMWCERDDLPDSPVFARALRTQAWEREV